MSFVSYEKQFDSPFINLVVFDFVIDSGDFALIFDSLKKYNFTEPILKINTVELEEIKNKWVSGFTLHEKTADLSGNWELVENIEVDNGQILILNESHIEDEILDDWLEKCITTKDFYEIENDGKICIKSGFGPGAYKVLATKTDDKVVGLKIEFIKEKID